MNEALVIVSKVIPKGWGAEKVFHDGPEYTFKLLYFHGGKTASFHFHKDKTETWYIHSGSINFKTICPNTGKQIENPLYAGQIIHLPAGVVHQATALEDTEIFEASTPHSDSDVYRIAPGDSQK